MRILVCNAGSTSLKFKLYDFPSEEKIAWGRIERVGSGSAAGYTFGDASGREIRDDRTPVPTYEDGIQRFLGDLGGVERVDAVGFKATISKGYPGVHVIDEGVLRGMRDELSIAPAHNRAYLGAIEAFRRVAPGAVPVAAFETAFHQTVPMRRRVYGVPYEWYEKYGVVRMGYHGASHSYVAARLKGYSRVVSCHLGGSSSVCAILDGKSADTSFGLSLQAGVTHVNRAGDVDAYILPYLLSKGVPYDEIIRGLDKNGGMAGISGLSGDMRDLRAAAKAGNRRARLAIDVFVSDVTRYIGAFAAEMGGIDALSFTAGIGENDPETRWEICSTLGFLGIVLSPEKNARGEERVSADDARVPVFVIPADEEIVVARETFGALAPLF